MRQHSRHTSERGQIIILAVLIMTVTFVVGAIAVDLTLYLSERRGSQTDADFSALAGAFQLLDPATTSGDAIQAATDNLDANDEQLNASLANPIVVDDSCYDTGVNDAVTVNVRHGSRALFLDIFGVTSPNIGAHAKACVGAAQSPGQILPFQIDDNGPCFDTNEVPIFTTMCPIELGSRGGTSSRGMLDLWADGDYCSDEGRANIEYVIEFGAAGICLINSNPSSTCPGRAWYDCVDVQNGNPQDILDGTAARLAKDGFSGCDPDGDGTDQFLDTVVVAIPGADPFTTIYEARDCDTSTPGEQKSPRLVTIVILEDEPPSGGGTFPIIAFAGFYLAGCAAESVTVDDESDLDADCTSPGPGPAPAPGSSSCGAPGHCVVYGRFVYMIESGTGTGPPTDQTTIFGISLVE